MRKKKTSSVYSQQLELLFPLLTEPNQSFTPRQIIDQFSRGELSAKSFDPSDMIDDDTYSDDEMVNHIVEFEDEFTAMEFMNTTKVKRNKKKDDTGSEERTDKGENEASESSGSQEA